MEKENSPVVSIKKSKLFSIKSLYILTMMFIIGIMIFSPFLVKNIYIIEEGYAELFFVLLLMTLAYAVTYLYKKQGNYYEDIITDINNSKKIIEERLNDAFKYIGKINIQMHETESALNKVSKYPESKHEMKYYLKYLADKILGMINADWIVLRIIDINKIKTLTEIYSYRNNESKIKPNISNKSLVNNEISSDFTVISSTENNFTINTYCIFPAAINKEEKIFIESIANQAEMLYIIYSSEYLKKKNNVTSLDTSALINEKV